MTPTPRQLSKYAQVMTVIERRVREGDYLLHNIPGERRIAEETGVSYMTARRAVSELLDRQVLIRRNNGSLDVHPRFVERTTPAKVVLLYPAYASPHFTRLRLIVAAALDERQMTLRPVQYVHWDDPIVKQALRSSGGALVIPAADTIPSWVLGNMRAHKAVVLDGDVSGQGIPSIELFPDEHIERVFDHLRDLGHRHIDCINTQHGNPEIDRRIDLWRRWLDRRDCDGQLWNDPAPSFTDPTPHAHQIAARLIDEEQSAATAFVCTTFPGALGTIRAFWERGRRVGKDVSVCSMNIEPPARFCCPSITGLDLPNLGGVLDRCFQWFSKDHPWSGERRLVPNDAVFFMGETTGRPCPRG